MALHVVSDAETTWTYLFLYTSKSVSTSSMCQKQKLVHGVKHFTDSFMTSFVAFIITVLHGESLPHIYVLQFYTMNLLILTMSYSNEAWLNEMKISQLCKLTRLYLRVWMAFMLYVESHGSWYMFVLNLSCTSLGFIWFSRARTPHTTKYSCLAMFCSRR